MSNKKVSIPHQGLSICLVPRDSLRRKLPPDFTFKLPEPGVDTEVTATPIPTPPPTNNNQGSTTFPILGNDRYGDCYMACVCHAAQDWTGANGHEAVFDVNKVINRYLQLSGGDNGLDTNTVMTEFEDGIIGPHGPYKILAEMAIDPTDTAAMRTAIYLFGCTAFTLGIPDAWLANPHPGGVWDSGNDVSADPNNGHAVLLTGYDVSTYDLQTWGFSLPVKITNNGVRVCDPEAVVMFSLDWFDKNGKAPNGFTYNQLADFWVTLGGQTLPPSPFPAPDPGPAPIPPTPPTPTPVQLPVYDISISGPLGMFNSIKTLTGTATPRVQAYVLNDEELHLLHQSMPVKLTPAQWEQVIQAVLQIIALFFPLHQSKRLTPDQWGKIIQLVLQLVVILLG